MTGAFSVAHDGADPQIRSRCRARAEVVIRSGDNPFMNPAAFDVAVEKETKKQYILELVLRNDIAFEKAAKEKVYQQVLGQDELPEGRELDTWMAATWEHAVKAQVKEKLKSALSKVHYTMQIFDVPMLGCEDSFGRNLRIMAHFVAPSSEKKDAEAKMYHLVLGFCGSDWGAPFLNCGYQAADTVYEVLADMASWENTGYFTDSDEACAVTQEESFVERFVEYTHEHFDLRKRQIHCLGCILELSIGAFCKKKNGVLEKIWKLAIDIGEYPDFSQYSKTFEKIIGESQEQDSGECPYYRILRLMNTSSRQRNAIRHLTINSSHSKAAPFRHYKLREAEWKTLTKLWEFVEPLILDTNLTGPPTVVPIGQIVPCIDFLIHRFDVARKEAKSTGEEDLRRRAKNAIKFLEAHLAQVLNNPVYTLGVILNPAVKFSYFDNTWTSARQAEMLRKVDKLTRKTWVREYKCSGSNTQKNEDTSHEPGNTSRPSGKRTWEEWITTTAETDPVTAEPDEYEEYLRAPLETPASNYQTPDDLVKYWANPERRKRWPRLTKMALDIVSIPAISPQHHHRWNEHEKPRFLWHDSMGSVGEEMAQLLRSWFLQED